MHCAEPGCLIACPAPGAIVQYANGIVDFQQDQCIGCGYCMTGCPFNVPKFAAETRRVYKCTLCVDRVSNGPAAGVRQGVSRPAACSSARKDDMLQIAERRVEQLKANGFAQAAVYDPPGVGGTSVVTVLAFGDQPELYGLPEESHRACRRAGVERAAEVARQPRDGWRRARRRHPLRALRTQGARARSRRARAYRTATSARPSTLKNAGRVYTGALL